MDLEKALRYYTTVAHTAHFGRAAEELGITQPPLSQGIKRLERALGYPLFSRTTRGVQLTAEGEQLLSSAQAVVAAADEFRDAAGSVKRASSTFPIGVSDRLPDETLAVVAGLEHIRVVGGPSSDLLAQLERGEIAAAVVDYPAPLPGMNGGEIIQVPAGVAARERVDSLRKLSGQPLVLPRRTFAPAAHDLLVDTVSEMGWGGPVIEVGSPREAFAHLLNGAGWAVVPRATKLPGTLRLSEPGSLPPLRFRTVWHADAPQGLVSLAHDADAAVRRWAADDERS